MPTAQQIRTEIDTDPKTLGYTTLKAQSNGREAVAAKMNEAGASAETLTRTWVDTTEALALVVGSEVISLAQANRDLLLLVMSTTRIKTGSATMRTTLGGIFAAGTTSRTNLQGLATRSASRAEALWGEGTVITATQVGEALEL